MATRASAPGKVATNPVSRLLVAIYRSIARLLVRHRVVVVAMATMLMIATVPVFQRLGSEFMPPLDEGTSLVMPTTFPGSSIEEARRALPPPQTLLVLSSLPFAVAGSIWLLTFMHYNLSTAVWVGLIAVAGVAAETGIVMVVYLDEAFERYMREGRIQKPEDVDAAVVEGASARVRPLVMTVATTALGLLPLLWEAGVGADVSARTAAPVVGGLWSCMFLTLLVLPAAYAMWRRHQVRATLAVSLTHDGQ